MSIDLMIVEVDLKTRMCTYAEVNGEEWTDMNEVLQLLFQTITMYYHAVIHTYSNRFYTSNPADSCYTNGILTLITNGVSFWGATIASGYSSPQSLWNINVRNAM